MFSQSLGRFLAQIIYIYICIVEIEFNILFDDHEDLLDYEKWILFSQCIDEETILSWRLRLSQSSKTYVVLNLIRISFENHIQFGGKPEKHMGVIICRIKTGSLRVILRTQFRETNHRLRRCFGENLGYIGNRQVHCLVLGEQIQYQRCKTGGARLCARWWGFIVMTSPFRESMSHWWGFISTTLSFFGDSSLYLR